MGTKTAGNAVKWYVYYEGDREKSCLARFGDIVRYSLEPYGGRLLVEGGLAIVKHGHADDLPYKLIAEFPDRGAAEQWYSSALISLILEKAAIWPDGKLLALEGVA